ncbi:MAG: hypothetical protein WCK49_09695 [Myxococcaceae bacterium]
MVHSQLKVQAAQAEFVQRQNDAERHGQEALGDVEVPLAQKLEVLQNGFCGSHAI